MASEAPSFHQTLAGSLDDGAPGVRGSIPYRQRLDDLANAIQKDLPQIRLTFPEYTPHDWDAHIVPLFDIAKRLFGEESLLALNATDRFLLAAGIYGHDWGMAVGPEERQAIIAAGKSGRGAIVSRLLPDEIQQLSGFARDQGLRAEADGSYPILLDDSAPYWAEYVRRTHAWRSGARVQQFLLNTDGDQALAKAGWTVCAGHWLDFDELRDAKTIWTHRMVGNERAHVRLVTILVRLTDLFDIGRDRTPYALRRFIGPSDPVSIMEWDKHNALDPIDCGELFPGRWQVIIRGVCSSPALWPSLCDLRRYLEDQLRQATGLLAEEYAGIESEFPEATERATKLGIFRLDSILKWEVRAEGFIPVEVRFEFERAGIFRILSKEIYGDDPHVFLRELLQNAVDATRQLHARLEQSDDRWRPTVNDCPIQFRVERADGRIKVVCRDFGIGMNEHIISHFLARAGASYYTSDEFLREQVNMDAISRFGIGLLSCFMVADKILIRTKRPAKFGGGDGFIIEIPGFDRHFHISSLSDPNWEGTEVVVEVLPAKLASLVKKEGEEPNFNVTRYLRHIAGFIDVPIYIEEDDKRLLILHPDVDPTSRPRGVPPDVEVAQLRGAYRWAEELHPYVMCPDLKVLSDYRVVLARDLGLSDIDGFVSFPMPCQPNGDMKVTSNGMLQGDNMTVQMENGQDAPSVYAKSLTKNLVHPFKPVLTVSEKEKNPSLLVYQDGVYVAGIGAIGQKIGDDPFPAHGWLNYRSAARSELTASRTSFSRDPKESPERLVIKARTFAFQKEVQACLICLPSNDCGTWRILKSFLALQTVTSSKDSHGLSIL